MPSCAHARVGKGPHACDLAEPVGTRLGATRESLTIDGDHAKRWAVSQGPLEAPLDLVGRLGGAEQKSVGEGSHPPYIKALSITRAQALPTTPRPEYPRPRQRRQHWASLNGTWQLGFDAPDFDRSIIVPFAYQSALSGIGERALHDTVWSPRRFRP